MSNQQELLLRAQQGDKGAQEDLGDIYYGRKDYKEAIKWYTLAAERGSAYAQYSVGHIYSESGQYENWPEAAKWWKLSASQGNKEAQFRLSRYYSLGRGVPQDFKEAARLCRLAANQDHAEAIEAVQDYEERASREGRNASSCIIATACMGESSERVAALRKLRDDGISADPLVRDFFHIFWSRYYEWSPTVARIASQDRAVAEHVRWSFLEPWFAWMEIATFVGQRDIATLTEDERRDLMARLGVRLSAWLAELPNMMENKCPSEPAQVFASFERFRTLARKAFDH